MCLIDAPAGSGKTTLLAQWCLGDHGSRRVFYGVTELFGAFDLRALDQRITRTAPDRPSG